MAKKKLNKKVVIIGSVAFMLMAVGVIGVILKLSQKPEKFIKLADDAMLTLTDIQDEEEKETAFEEIKLNYFRAKARTKPAAPISPRMGAILITARDRLIMKPTRKM